MQKAIDKIKILIYIIVAKREKERRKSMKQKNKYRELVELKGLLREKKINYETLSKKLKMSLSSLSNKINGKSIFNIVEIANIVKIVGIQKEDIPAYFF